MNFDGVPQRGLCPLCTLLVFLWYRFKVASRLRVAAFCGALTAFRKEGSALSALSWCFYGIDLRFLVGFAQMVVLVRGAHC